jgi:hypothetical protein
MRQAKNSKQFVCTASFVSANGQPTNLVCQEVASGVVVNQRRRANVVQPGQCQDPADCLCDLDFNELLTALVDMRLLWADHVLYTRLAIEEDVDANAEGREIQTLPNLPETNLLIGSKTPSTGTLGRLYQNQQDLGNNLAIFYCDANGHQYADILTRHIDGAVAVLGDLIGLTDPNQDQYALNTKLASDQAIVFANAREFSHFWACVNPYINEEELYQHMLHHISTLVDVMKTIIAALLGTAVNPSPLAGSAQAVVAAQDAYTQATEDMSLMFFEATRRQWEEDCNGNGNNRSSSSSSSSHKHRHHRHH